MELVNTDVVKKQDCIDYLPETPGRAYLYKYIAEENVSAILFIDVDNFKYINDCYGYKFGDCLLKYISIWLEDEVGSFGKVFVFGGDKFVAVINRCTESEIISMARQIIKKLETMAFYVEGQEVLLTISIGAYIPEKRNEPAENMIRKADIALFKAKRNGKSQLAFYDKPMDDEIKRKLLLTSEMRKSMNEKEFSVHYQPIFNISMGKVTEAEALLRWESRTLGSVSPAEFVPVAEENGLISGISYFVMESVFKQLKLWEKEGIEIKVAINISPVQLLNRGFISSFKELVRKFDIDYRKIKFEITETQILTDEGGIVKFLGRMLKTGLDISLDDFGVGFSSIKNMILFPISEIKIDKSFTDKLLHDEKAEAIVESVIHAAKKLGYKVTAEGVETKRQFEKLKYMGCDKIQGYYISKPMPPEGIIAFIRSLEL
ncbi:putative bifunctional diguanylate cyclase/phosphodiesterase [Fonticella tunisiensis]|uniref:Diguanylate cyclase (GGDEF)-like protein n=1 Tax=Fonticella tunisiensis TaxID=1096341 RepID=A0A4V6Q2S7_9CLOT|nr:bifunctional diguanylate cyclase/phosphodiesterase [Fonticella tunisiensis]TDT50275.1 diguanylate cyclase (GGDEF)-like protein [Fonticella tunisiensis]